MTSAVLAFLRRLLWKAGFSKRRRLYREGYESMAAEISARCPSSSSLKGVLADRELLVRSLEGDAVSGAYASGEAQACRVELSRRSVD